MIAEQIWAVIAVGGVAALFVFAMWPRARKLDGVQKYSEAADRGAYGEDVNAPPIDLSVFGGADSSSGDSGADGGAGHH